MSDPRAQRPTSVVTRNGLEVTVPTPTQVDGSLIGFYVLLLMVAPLAFALADVRAEAMDGWLDALGQLVGWWWLALGLVMSVLVMVFVRFSNDHFVFGARVLRRQHRTGRIVLSSSRWRLSRIASVEATSDAHGVWTVHLRGAGTLSTSVTISPLGHDDAENLAARIRRWLEAPGEMPVESHGHVATPVLIAESVVSLVTSRLSLVLPLFVATAGLLVLAIGWQLREAQHGRAEPLPRLDRVADGELLEYRWVVHAPRGTEHPTEARTYLRVAIAYVPEDGERRVLWLRTRSAPTLYWMPGELARTSSLLGLPALEFELPVWTRPAVGAGQDWEDWHALSSVHAFEPSYFAARLLEALDAPFAFLLAAWTAPAPDWSVAYSAGSPERAMPLRWAQAERTAMERLPLRDLAPVAGIALALVMLTLPRLVPGASVRGLGRIVALGVVLAIPWWADRAERLAGRFGAGERALDLASDVVRTRLPHDLTEHAVLTRSRPPSGPERGEPVRWTPQRSASAALLRSLGLDTPPAELPLPDSASAVEYMHRRAYAALSGLSDSELDAFVDAYERAGYRTSLSDLHEAVVEPALRAVRSGRSSPGPHPSGAR